MISRRAQGLENFVVLAKSAALTAAFWVTFALLQIFPRENDSYPVDRYLLYNIVAIVGLLIACFREEISGINFFQTDFLRAIRVAARELLFIFATLAITLILTKDVKISRLFLIIFAGLCGAILLFTQRMLPTITAKFLYGGSHRHETILIGSPARAEKLRKWLQNVSQYGIHAFGILTDYSDQVSLFGLQNLGTPDDLPRLLGTSKIGSVILLDTPEISRLRKMMEWTDAAGVRLLVLNTLAEDIERPLRYYRHQGIDFITVREEPLQDPASRMFKRIFDLLIAGVAVSVVLPPLTLVVYLMQRLQAPGPLFYRQKRAGMGNAAFYIFKFRTMRVHSHDPAQQATINDDRIYPFGRFLRRTSLDEIPQFLNVISGDMSVVGPRPHMLNHNERFAKAQSDYHIRTFVRPGITGLAQIRGFRGEAHTMADIRDRVRCDLEYIERWSPGLDVAIVLRTVVQVFRPPKTAF